MPTRKVCDRKGGKGKAFKAVTQMVEQALEKWIPPEKRRVSTVYPPFFRSRKKYLQILL
jgi:hypothetical protein